MYSARLQDTISQLSEQLNVSPSQISLIRDSATCLLGVVGNAINADVYPREDILEVSIRLLLLDEGISALADQQVKDNVHYLIGMGFEQTGYLLTRIQLEMPENIPFGAPLDNDLWYRLVLGLLHYLAGGHRVQALTMLRQLNRLANKYSNIFGDNEYQTAFTALQDLYSGQIFSGVDVKNEYWQSLIFQQGQTANIQEIRLKRLSKSIQERRNVVLESLGQNNATEWLSERADANESMAQFWSSYLSRLVERGITTFTQEQIGPGFDTWLRLDKNVLVTLPTGSGKTIIGELLSALTLTDGKQVAWLLPTRALVRQVKGDLRDAFESLNVRVEELPTTEEYDPVIANLQMGTRHIAVTTPEKLNALIRAHPDSIQRLGLVVFDEAQLLLKNSRATTAENVLLQIHQLVPDCKFVLMTAFPQVFHPLIELLSQLIDDPFFVTAISSTQRPTRRIYGVVTETEISDKLYPEVVLYPPEENLDTYVQNPIRMVVKDTTIPKSNLGATSISQRFLRPVTSASLRSVFFVLSKVSTESQAKKIAKGVKSRRLTTSPSKFDIARLRVELGRQSAIELTVKQGVVPHHAALTELEQSIAEKWVKDDVVNTVVATPTLAEGINLPFDISIVSYLQRYNRQSGTQEPLSISEIQNMLGRAGRAGQVTDGICLIACKSNSSNGVQLLNWHKHYFFSDEADTVESIGFRRLVYQAVAARINTPDWLLELDQLSFSQSQDIVSFIIGSISDNDDFAGAIEARIKEYPSMQVVPEQTTKEIAIFLAEVGDNIQDRCGSDPLVAKAMAKTGMPYEIIVRFLDSVRSNLDIQGALKDEQVDWCDDVIVSALKACQLRNWYKSIFEEDNLDCVIIAIRLWRNGSPLNEIEKSWLRSERNNTIKIGEFLRQKMSQLAQFWGALSVCSDLVLEDLDLVQNPDSFIPLTQTFVREGVSSRLELEWLRRIGGLDRVLAHKLASISVVSDTPSELSRYVRQQLGIWRSNVAALPTALDELHLDALRGIL